MQIPLRLAVLSVALALLLSAPAGAQRILDVDQELDFERTESWAMKYFASANLFTGLGPPRQRRPGSLEVGLEALWVPTLSERERTVGFNGSKTEDLNKTSVFARPRLTVGLPAAFSLELSYVPPVEVFDVEPDLLAAAIGRPLHETARWRLGARAFAQYGTLKGDFTCPAEEAAAGDDLLRNPFRCEATSRDEMTLRVAGLELSAALRPRGAQKVEPYAAFGVTRMDLDFQVGARYAGIVDSSRLLTEGNTLYLAAGVEMAVGEKLRFGAELFYTALDVIRPPSTSSQNDALFHLRAALRYAV